MCDNYIMDHLDAQEPTPKDNNRFFTYRVILPAILVLTILATVIPFYRYIHGEKVFFNGALFLPIILTCIYFPKRGILFSTCVSICYFLVLIIFPRYPALFVTAIIRIICFEIVAIISVNLSNRKNKTILELKRQRENLEIVVRERTATLTRELEQSKRIETVYRTTMDLYDVCIRQLRMYYVQWNAELYITRTNEPFEELIGRVKSDLVGRKIATIPWLEEASRNLDSGSVIIPIIGPDRKTRSVLWIFTEMFTENSDSPFMIVGTGIAIPEDRTIG